MCNILYVSITLPFYNNNINITQSKIINTIQEDITHIITDQ